MSIQALNWAFGQTLPMSEKFALVVLANYADDRHSCFPSQERIASDMGASVTTARRCAKRLEEAGYLTRSKRMDGAGNRTSDRYHLAVGQVITTGQSDHRSDWSPVNLDGPTGQSDRSLPVNEGVSTGQSDRVTTINHQVEPPENHQVCSPEPFDQFWEAYPRRVAKKRARTKFDAAVKQAGADRVIEGARRFASDPNLPPMQFIPHPATWLEQGRWDDPPLPPRHQGQATADQRRVEAMSRVSQHTAWEPPTTANWATNGGLQLER